MDQDFLPSEIIIDILSRLHLKTVIRCKCVCKSWLELLETPEFAKNHLSRSVPGLIVYDDVFNIYEFVDDLELGHHGLHYNLVTKYNITTFSSVPPPDDSHIIAGSVNGLVLLSGTDYHPSALYVCNPITHEYIELPCLDPYQNYKSVSHGFGVSMKSGQYKVVRILQECVFGEIKLPRISKSECWVYTLGTGAWRRSIVPCPFYDDTALANAFLNGNLHGSVEDINDGSYFCFDLETEVFSTFSPPPPLRKKSFRSDPLVFEDCLCICDNIINSDNEIVIWVMKEYGNDKSWTKQFVLTKHPDPDLAIPYLACVNPLKLFKDGDILLLWENSYLFYYSKKSNTAQKLVLLKHHVGIEARQHVSSFLALGSFAMETLMFSPALIYQDIWSYFHCTTPTAKYRFN